jgi:midasin
MQLMFIVSDGRIERDSRTSIRRLVREMMERNILLVLIIVETGTEDSIAKMKEVSFVKGKPVVTNFMEDYPFPYYILLNNMDKLPEILGDALRQWFELLARTS